MMKRSSSTSLALAVAILAIVCCIMPCSAFKAGQDQIAATINSAGYKYKAHEPQGGHVGWRPPPPRPKRPCRSSYPDYGSEYVLVPPPATLNDGHETQAGEDTGVGGYRQGRMPPSPWRGPGYGHR